MCDSNEDCYLENPLRGECPCVELECFAVAAARRLQDDKNNT